MRIYIEECHYCHRRIYLNVFASTRTELANKIGYSFQVQCPLCGNYSVYTVDNVFAEMGQSSVPGGAILGGLIGLVGGPLGALIGGAIGSTLGANADEDEKRRVLRFNQGVP